MYTYPYFKYISSKTVDIKPLYYTKIIDDMKLSEIYWRDTVTPWKKNDQTKHFICIQPDFFYNDKPLLNSKCTIF